ncbi:MAG: bifunctional DNA-formamidopyrimidine glycosylase/DNA-(apurinic or apyrimidinic site) lyase [Planctomycetota bacterium]|nr:bifunctional DNA-formamidopyrimidine glycosylase/DNA-(apurinic or apyrimidinic site) lyase [Planctomycetaceae bacterium]MDQ3332547.1 bifunctional DNA-formamidopyrimidine glycosylase/DNA-(apurinic or apyrimidinic site) lyase [Planctomycetota bacterium]
MPELPEVETMVRGIRPHVVGRTLASFRRSKCGLKVIDVSPEPKRLARIIRGQTITSVRRFAKRVVLTLSEGGDFVIEPRMTGLMLLSDPPTTAHLRVEWRFMKHATSAYPSLWFWDRRGLGTVHYYGPGQFEELVCTRLGPDALAMNAELWTERLARTARPVKVALLDQTLVAGIGNLYASEILYLSRIHPARPANALSRREIARLAAAVQEVLDDAILHEGSTLADGTYRNALAQNGRYQNSHRVYARTGMKCPSCDAAIERIVQAQRSTFFCGRCQR